MADVMVQETQVWLNKTYGRVSGFGSVPENGRTGWPTIYGLIKGLQIELGITALSNNFGPTTLSKFNAIQHTLVIGGKYNKNIARIIQGGFWCKGYNVAAFDGVLTDKTMKQVWKLNYDAGMLEFSSPIPKFITGQMMKALLDMSAFVLVSGGDSNVRSIQQALNKSYNAHFGVLPCDGIYQRDSNKALIYALQDEMGMTVGVANGYFGVGTTANCPTLGPNQGKAAYVKILQYSLYVNGFNQNAVFDGIYSTFISNEVLKYRKFMRLSPENSNLADMRVIKGLMVSHGDQTRMTYGADMATQLKTQSQVNILKNNGYTTVGRYLTGTVGMDFRPKNLTIPEVQLLKKNNMTIFPIYQDGGYYLDYFKKEGQGYIDAKKAISAARKLGFKKGTTIYFACDFDALGDEIEQYLVPYFREIFYYFLSEFNYYTPSAYGPRSLLIKLTKLDYIEGGFVSNMSSGFSGNLGYKMPDNWTFDQYFEYNLNGIDIDKVSISERGDTGQTSFNPPLPVDKNGLTEDQVDAFIYKELLELQKQSPIFKLLPTTTFKRDVEMRATFGVMDIRMVVSMQHKTTINKQYNFVVKNGEVDTVKFQDDFKILETAENIKEGFEDTVGLITKLGRFVSEDGNVEMGFVPDNHLLGCGYGIELVLNSETEIQNEEGQKINQKYSVGITIFFRSFTNIGANVVEAFSQSKEKASNSTQIQIQRATTVFAVTAIGVAGIAILGGIPALITAATLSFITFVLNDSNES